MTTSSRNKVQVARVKVLMAKANLAREQSALLLAQVKEITDLETREALLGDAQAETAVAEVYVAQAEALARQI